MRTRVIGIFLFISAFVVAVSCVRERRRDVNLLSDKKIEFTTANIAVAMTRSSETDTVSLSDRLFLGMLDGDSLFLRVSQEDFEQDQMTKAGGEEKPQSMGVVAFKDNESEPYSNLTLTSEDGWQTYTPAMYWPEYYDEVHFFASNPNEQNVLFVPQFVSGGGEFKVSFDYTVITGNSKGDADLHQDLYYAISPNKNEDNSSEAVPLEFIHLFSSVEFQLGYVSDANVTEAIVELSDVMSKGSCSITYPVSIENIEWSTDGTKSKYSQKIESGKSFKLIPQELEGADASFVISMAVGELVHTFPAVKFDELPVKKWIPNKRYIYTIEKSDEVKVNVKDDCSDTQMSNVKIQNTGFTNSYIRAAVVGYWMITLDGMEVAAALWDINDENVGTLTLPDGWSSSWKEVNGYYYHLSPVEPGEYTFPLFESYTLKKTTGPVSGSQLKVFLVTQAVEEDKAKEMWPDL